MGEMGESMVDGNGSGEPAADLGRSYIPGNFSVGSWDDTNSIAFLPGKRARDSSDDMLASFGHIDSQVTTAQEQLVESSYKVAKI